jgi:Ser/Thr protein kinase RdoA (MazF antagonist)
VSEAPPFAGLTPECVLDAVDSIGLITDGRQFGLNSFENRVYQVGVEDAAPVIVKFYRPERWSDAQILEEHEFLEELVSEEIPAVAAQRIGAATLHHHAGFRFTVFTRQGGRAPDLEQSDTLVRLGRYLGRIHAVGRRHDFAHRPALDLESFGRAPRAWLLEHGTIPAELLPAWSSVTELALEGVARAFERAGDVGRLRLHGDCHVGNVLWTDAGPHFVDFDDSRSGPAIQDLWMLLSGDRVAMGAQLRSILEGYEDFSEFDDRELHLVEALRTLRLLHYSYWLAHRWNDPAFPAAFPWFNTTRYWQDRILELREQAGALDEPPLVVA